ncbi:carboxypeptidase-like regulatory domain-containing protein [Fulvivirgaceae bacterium PWU4]|uniref:Carboxypeptidase-like regulatory domain-containing protein n=1 Tax=Chryseosolibacter histidini TaxID=2782349 RepID=A0AAP2GLQ2_9BACT|nr:carboxypeptidase-like regulatory domain-containing protein [Chryseosolibacter histidini]MBT1700671.1 carboxypeptidase-like regulatory domain-containing protein [Chryseosolibacter histidini]
MGQSCMVKGKVVEAYTGELLTGAGIRSLADPSQGTVSDGNGSFELSAAAEDTLIVTFIGYADEIVPVAALEGCTVTIKMTALPRDIDAVEIKAERIIAEEFTIRKIRKLDIYTNPSAKADPILAVNSMPSATTTDESANISLRGGSPAETGIFLNNVPINDAVRYSQLNGIGTFSIFNTALINNVQVYAGNPPLEYGNSTSGLIALQTDENIPARPTSSIALTLASTGFYSTRKLNERSSLTVFGNYHPSALLRSMNARALKNLESFSSGDLGLHYYGRLSDNTVVKVFNYSLYESYRFHQAQPTYDGVFDQQKVRNFTVGNIRKRIGNTELSFNQGLSFSQADYVYGTTDIDLALHDLFSSFNIHRSGHAAEWKAGISYDHKSSDFTGTFPRYAFAAGKEHPVVQAAGADHVSNPEVYAYYKRFLGSRWIAGAGIRKNIAIENLKDYVSLQGNIHYKASENLTVNVSAGRYHKYQLPQGARSGSSLIRSFQYSADVNYTTSSLEANFSTFYKRSFVQGVTTDIKGAEVFTRYKISNSLRVQLSLTSLDAIATQSGESQPSPYNIHYFIRGNVEYKIQGTWTITTVFLFRQGSYYYPVTATTFRDDLQVYEPTAAQDPARLPAYNTIDVSVSKIFALTQKSSAVAFASCGNIFNMKNVRDYTYNYDYSKRDAYLFSLRTFYIGIIINF